jgi:hypothetical protein
MNTIKKVYLYITHYSDYSEHRWVVIRRDGSVENINTYLPPSREVELFCAKSYANREHGSRNCLRTETVVFEGQHIYFN